MPAAFGKQLTAAIFCGILLRVMAMTEKKISQLSMSGEGAGVQRACGRCEQVLTDMYIHSRADALKSK